MVTTTITTKHIALFTHQDSCRVNWSDARSKIPSEEFTEVAVLGEVLNGSVFEATTKQPDVEAECGTTQPRRQL